MAAWAAWAWGHGWHGIARRHDVTGRHATPNQGGSVSWQASPIARRGARPRAGRWPWPWPPRSPAAATRSARRTTTEVKTVYVPVFRSLSFRRDIQLQMTEMVIKEIEKRTPYKVVGTPDEADSILEGMINYAEKNTVVENPYNLPRQELVQVNASVKWTQNPPTEEERNAAPVDRSARPSTSAPEIGETSRPPFTGPAEARHADRRYDGGALVRNESHHGSDALGGRIWVAELLPETPAPKPRQGVSTHLIVFPGLDQTLFLPLPQLGERPSHPPTRGEGQVDGANRGEKAESESRGEDRDQAGDGRRQPGSRHSGSAAYRVMLEARPMNAPASLAGIELTMKADHQGTQEVGDPASSQGSNPGCECAAGPGDCQADESGDENPGRGILDQGSWIDRL